MKDLTKSYYIAMKRSPEFKIDTQERIFYKTQFGELEIILDKTKDNKILGVEILEDISE